MANPANTNALILQNNAPSIPAKNITCLTRLDHNRALGQISERLARAPPPPPLRGAAECGSAIQTLYNPRSPAPAARPQGLPSTEVKNVIIWGNHSSTQYPDVNHGTAGGKPIREAVGDDAWRGPPRRPPTERRRPRPHKARTGFETHARGGGGGGVAG